MMTIKKFYLFFLALPVLAFTLLYLSVWWFSGGIAVLLVFIAYQFYAERYKALQDRYEVMGKELEDIHVRLEHAVVKEQKANKQAGQLSQMKQQLLSVLSHEVRTPMNGVIGMALLLEDTPLTEEQKEYISVIRNCSESLLTTVNNILVSDLLDFSKLHQEGTQLEYKEFNLRDTIEEVLELFSEKAAKAGLDLIYEIDDNVPAQIIGDTKRTRQLLMNLVENAVKFTHLGEIFVGLHYTPHNASGYPPELKWEVRDTGIGIEKEQLKYLFNGIPGKDSKQEREGGGGLGLMICKKLAELMGGQIEAQSTPGQGSLFTVTVPITPSLKAPRNHAREKDMHLLEGRQVLITDDNLSSGTVLANQLKAWKMQPVYTATASEALKMLAENKNITAVIADINMPETDGVQLAKSISSLYPSIPVIGLSLPGFEEQQAARKEFASMLRKPLRQHILRDHLLNLYMKTPGTSGHSAENKFNEAFAGQYPLRILLAEDNIINQKIATKILTTLGYQPALANNGREVLEIVANEQFDIILMDVQMPVMDGLEATRMIRTCLEVQPVVIALTANVMQGDRDACMQAGMDDYMSKPIELEELLSQLEKWHQAIADKRRKPS